MTIFHYLPYPFLFLISCTDVYETPGKPDPTKPIAAIGSIRDIPLPNGFNYSMSVDSLYANWLLDLKIKKSRTVYLYNGDLKENQHAHFAVLDLDIGKKDLVQCADAAMKLRADHLFGQKKYSEIKFTATSGDELSFDQFLKGTRWNERGGKLISFTSSANQADPEIAFELFMEIVFSYCGTFSLSKQLKEVSNPASIQPGDVFIQGGFPGHAVTVMAVAKNNEGKKIFLLSQGYMPAQDIHILRNYVDPGLSPWYDTKEIYPLHTPEWQFEKGSLKRWR